MAKWQSDSWACFRCGTVSPSPHDGDPPTICLTEIGGCGRAAECVDHDMPAEGCVPCEGTRFFPADWGKAKMALYVDAEVGTEGRILFKRLIDTWEHYIEFGNPWHPKLLSLFQFQSYFYPNLPAVFYIGLTGPSGSAKTTVLEILRDTCYNGILTGDASVSAIARKLNTGCTMLLDEVDEIDKDKKELVFAAARRGYRPGNIYLRTLYSGKGGKTEFEEIKTYGPKAFSFLTDIESALKSRTVEIPTIRVKGDPFGKVLGNLARGPRALAALRSDLESYSTARLKEWPTEAISSYLGGYSFREKVENAVGPTPVPRAIEITAICLLIADIADVEIAQDTRTAMESQAIFEDEQMNDIVQWVKEAWGGREWVKMGELRDGFNASRKAAGDKPIHHKRFRAILREVGIREGEDLKRLSHSGHHILVFNDYVKKKLGIDGSPASFTIGQGWFTQVIDASPAGEGTIRGVKNQEEEVKQLVKHSKDLARGGDGSFTLSDLLIKASESNIDEVRVKKWIERWLRDGELYSPIMGVYKWT